MPVESSCIKYMSPAADGRVRRLGPRATEAPELTRGRRGLWERPRQPPWNPETRDEDTEDDIESHRDARRRRRRDKTTHAAFDGARRDRDRKTDLREELGGVEREQPHRVVPAADREERRALPPLGHRAEVEARDLGAELRSGGRRPRPPPAPEPTHAHGRRALSLAAPSRRRPPLNEGRSSGEGNGDTHTRFDARTTTRVACFVSDFENVECGRLFVAQRFRGAEVRALATSLVPISSSMPVASSSK